MNYKINKYLHKIEDNQRDYYLKKILFYLTQDGSISPDPIKSYKNFTDQAGGGIKMSDIKSILTKLEDIYNKAPKTTTHKFVVFLYAPPASGKTLAKKVAVDVIKNFYEPDMNHKDIEDSFIDTNVDDLTYEIETVKGKSVKDLLIENINSKFDNTTSQNDKLNYIKNNINDFAKESGKIYFDYRKKADPLSELLHYFAILFDRNILIEISSPDFVYIDKVAKSVNWYGYSPIVIYPYVNSLKILMDRSIRRGLNEGRIVPCDFPYGIKEKMINMINGFDTIKKMISENRNYKNYTILQYDSNIPEADYNEFNKYNFSNFNKYIMDISYKRITIDGEETISKRIIDYNSKIKVNEDCSVLDQLSY